MSAVTFDTHEFVKSLEAAGMPVAQAEAVSAGVRKAQDSADIATRGDVRELELRLRKDIELLEQRMVSRFTLLHWMIGLLTAGTGTIIIKLFWG